MTASDLPVVAYTAAQVRELDRIAIEEFAVPGIVLMKRAGRAAFEQILAYWPKPEAITVFCGVGNNAGDGYIIAGLAAQQNFNVRVVTVAETDKLTGDARLAFEFAKQASVPIESFSDDTSLDGFGVVVDALLGTGLNGEVRSRYQQAIELINRGQQPVLAVDIPSGLCADTGNVLGCSVVASVTVTFIGLKQGLLTGDAADYVGDVRFDSLSVPGDVYKSLVPAATRLSYNSLSTLLPPRARVSHKGHFGHVLVVGGNHGMGGAALMAAQAAARCGAGLISVATQPEHVSAFLARQPEIMVKPTETVADLVRLLSTASVVVVGPGLGRDEWAQHFLSAVIKSPLPTVFDADGLNLIAEAPALLELAEEAKTIVLTPHPAEAARLLGVETQEINRDRFAAAAKLAANYKAAVVLKGAGSVVATTHALSVSDYGNPGMAGGGMGDVLSGVIGALLAQHLTAFEAAQLGTVVHGLAADRAAENGGERGLLATDLLPHLRQLLNGM
ncbi:NAD(P)H-hydrate dehydratase [Aurantivibrio plasticivorans]